MALRVDDVDLARDRTLVERFQAGDDQAFDELYRRYFRRLERFCARRVGDGSEAEELAQEAFARAYKAMPNLAGERRFYPWVSVIAARLCIDSHRRRARTEPSDIIDLGGYEGGLEEVEKADDVALLRKALDRLGPRHREVLQLREQEGWSYQRIADHYDVTLGTVEALLFRARKALRREFVAVAGDDDRTFGFRGFLLAMPGVAWLARRTHGIRSKISEVFEPGLPQLLAGGAAAVAIGGVTVLGGSAVGGAPANVAAHPPQQVASEPSPASLSVPSSAVTNPPAAEPRPAVGAAAAGGVAAPQAPTAPTGPVSVGGVSFGSGASEGAKGPRQEVGPVFIVGDPVQAVVQNIDETLEHLPVEPPVPLGANP